LNSYPIDSIFPELKETVLRNSSVVLHAPPGAGKTTRVPLALLDLIPAEKKRIIMLEPRRIAAVSAARWMAKNLGEEVGQTVGYSIRFDRKVSEKTRIEVVTEGILTRRIQTDPGLEGVAMVIFDEFHERSLHADLALSLCLDLRKVLREDLKLLVMSATLDCAPISSLLGGVPVIISEGKSFPVEERYLVGTREKMTLSGRVADAVNTALKQTSGDILVFLPGAGEIRACTEALRAALDRKDEVVSLHPLYGDLPFEEQERAILPSKNRKIVLATNIAETSLTIEGVKVVVDTGLTRRLQYNPSTGMNRLITVSVSKASAEQRKGRAGRLGPGVCYRLYSRNVFQGMVPFSSPEILVTDLSSLVLELAVWGIKEPLELLWLDAPPEAAWNAALDLLKDLEALDQEGSVTAVGRQMARLPLHPRLSRMMQRAGELSCQGLGAELAALLSERDILRSSVPHRMHRVKEVDVTERLGILHAWREGRQTNETADPLALRSVDRTAKQILKLTGGKIASVESASDPDMISRLLLCGFPDRVAKLREEGDGRFLLSQGRGVHIQTVGGLSRSLYIIALNVDVGEKAEGIVHLAAHLDEGIIREECEGRIQTLRRVEWDKREKKIIATVEERLGAVSLSERPFRPPEEEIAQVLREAIRSDPKMLNFSREARQYQGRVELMRRIFPSENWPDFSDAALLSAPEWLLPGLGRMRSVEDIAGLDILTALKARLSWNQQRLIDERLPASLIVPSGNRVAIDYASGDIPVLAVKLQEMFGLADTPELAEGRVKMLLHLLSPARRPVQITQDLKGFWNSGYQQVKRELKGRYPKHPWPDDPWNAVPTRKTKPRKKR
jgi:ATP-dependent helicase HrpB